MLASIAIYNSHNKITISLWWQVFKKILICWANIFVNNLLKYFFFKKKKIITTPNNNDVLIRSCKIYYWRFIILWKREIHYTIYKIEIRRLSAEIFQWKKKNNEF